MRSDALKYKKSSCKSCGASFFLERGANGDWKKTKTCSAECRKLMYQLNAGKSMHSKKAKAKSWESRKSMNLHNHMLTADAKAKSAKAAKEVGIKRRGTPHSGMAALNCPRKSRLIIFTSPWGTKHEAVSVVKFVRENLNLFAGQDTIMRRKSRSAKSGSHGNLTCAAMSGLGNVACGSRNSWKDWTCVIYEQ